MQIRLLREADPAAYWADPAAPRGRCGRLGRSTPGPTPAWPVGPVVGVPDWRTTGYAAAGTRLAPRTDPRATRSVGESRAPAPGGARIGSSPNFRASAIRRSGCPTQRTSPVSPSSPKAATGAVAPAAPSA